MSFWDEFWSADQSRVHTPQVIFFGISVILLIVAIAVIITHFFIRGKPLDGEVVKLLLGLLGGGVLNSGASYFSKTTFSQVTQVGKDVMPGEGKDIKPE